VIASVRRFVVSPYPRRDFAVTESELLERASKLLSRINDFPSMQPVRLTLGELRRGANWGDWSRKPGIYYFIKDDQVVYIGRAVPSVGIGNRIGTHINEYSDPEWAAIIQDEQAICGVLPFPDLDWHWLGTLEMCLIDGDSRPRFNKRF
jgi:hypothetical protein